MLASINPLGERSRNQRYAVTVTAYVAASSVAALGLGALLGFVGMPFAASALVVGAIGVLAAVGLAVDARVLGARVPGPRRQVDENWLATYRGWVYGAGFGAQLGIAFATIVTATATWIAFACAFVAGSPVGGAIVGAVFGFVRALPILATRTVRDPTELRSLIARLARWRPRRGDGDDRVPGGRGVCAGGVGAMIQLAAHGLGVRVPSGWEARIRRRPALDTGERTYPVMHAATFVLPEHRDDFGGGVTTLMRSSDVFVALFEYGPEAVETPLFAARGIPRVQAKLFATNRLQRPLAGQLGCQQFFTQAGRAFCLYVVAGK